VPIDIRARLVSAPRRAGYSSSLLATQASYYGDSLAQRGADAAWLTRSALEYEALGYDSALIPQRSGWPDVWALTAWALATTTQFAIAAAHRVGL
jgi:alkanesulfonate monooxygenase SsuD/methylene tetrahydromethanopterin reductase-like flavin-dependent oxidoreductase (luciferase family)